MRKFAFSIILAAFSLSTVALGECREWHLDNGTTLQSCTLDIAGIYEFFTDTDLNGQFNPGRIAVIDNTLTNEQQMQFTPAYRMGGSNPEEGIPGKPNEDPL